MGLTIDQQTLTDLQIIGRPGTASLYALFNGTVTQGGALLLEDMFRMPLSDRQAISSRMRAIDHFTVFKIAFPFSSESLDVLEEYLGDTDDRSALADEQQTVVRRLSNLITGDDNYKAIAAGVTETINLLQTLDELAADFFQKGAASVIEDLISALTDLTQDPGFAELLAEKKFAKRSYDQVAAYDRLIRFSNRKRMTRLLNQVYLLDVYQTVARVAAERRFTLPRLLAEAQSALHVEGIFHPMIAEPVGNDISVSPGKNVVFLTGANMAGKSTFMKSLGVVIYLAHMGFPVPAKKMSFSVFDGLYTTINLPDDIQQGNSHFYAEVLRVKKIAKEVGQDKKLFVIFDELFRGTNVKDAYEGTVAITEAFAEKTDSLFVLSTHIIEAGEILKQRCDNINFVFLPTRMENHTPVYTYRLEQGITADRHGMVIIQNEGILEILNSRKLKQ
jgi:DNA mismatch repair ATPase MutS